MDLYNLIVQKPVSPNVIYNQISHNKIAKSLNSLIDERYEELKTNDVFFNNFSSLASISLLIEQNKKQNLKKREAKLQSYLLSKDFFDKFNELLNERQAPNTSP